MSSASLAPPVLRRARRRNPRRRNTEVVFSMNVAMPRMAVSEAVQSSVHTRRDMYEVAAWLVTSNVVQATQQLYIQLGTIVNDFTSLASVFDQYRVDRCEAWLVPRVSGTSSASQNYGQMLTVVDYDDVTALTSFAAGTSYANALIGAGNCGHYRDFVPHVAIAAYQGGFTAFANTSNEWIDAAYPNVQHYGIKAVSTVTDTAYSWDLILRVTSSWRNTR